jgi:hypothetical protein
MKILQIGKNTEFDKEVAARMLELMAQARAPLLYSNLIEGLNGKPELTSQLPYLPRLFRAGAGKEGYLKNMLQALEDQRLIETSRRPTKMSAIWRDAV